MVIKNSNLKFKILIDFHIFLGSRSQDSDSLEILGTRSRDRTKNLPSLHSWYKRNLIGLTIQECKACVKERGHKGLERVVRK